MLCKICESPSSQLFKAKILDTYNTNYFLCKKCGYIQTEEPVWLQEAYSNPINIEDTGLLQRNILFSKRAAVLLFFLFNRNGNFLDFAGGYGLFVRLMRDKGFNFYWEDSYTENIFARGFEYRQGMEIELITVFECFEHFNNPIKELENLLSRSRNILFSTELYLGSPPLPEEWDYYGFSHGQHLGFYTGKTLRTIADKYKLNLYSNNKSFHLLTEKRINKYLFNLILKCSVAGLSGVVSALLKKRTKTDSKNISQSRSS